MNVATITQSRQPKTLRGFFSRVMESYRRYSDYKNTVRELNKLSRHELNDLGISPGSIHSVAYAAAYGIEG